MDLKNTHNLLQNLKQKLDSIVDFKTEVKKIILDVVGIELTEKSIEIRENIVFLKINNIKKNVIFLHKKAILERFGLYGGYKIRDLK